MHIELPLRRNGAWRAKLPCNPNTAARPLAAKLARCALALAFAPVSLAMAQTAAAPAGNAKAAKDLFNQYCYHCHGTDAVQGERPRDPSACARCTHQPLTETR
jgi:mono/diheme cytochrome c family protein